MQTIANPATFDFTSVPVDTQWNTADEKELKIHRIHTYPAKFPSFITQKAISYAKEQNLHLKLIADIFCGCGTVAFESKRSGIDFWGVDINPIATLIAKVKSHKYQRSRLIEYYSEILNQYTKLDCKNIPYGQANERIQYWFEENQYHDLDRLLRAIKLSTPKNSIYNLFFICAFSNILKSTSRWLSSSIKPQIDPDKVPDNVITKYLKQCEFMFKVTKGNDDLTASNVLITTKDILKPNLKLPKVDLIITSPPYATSYEYADLHQLSTLWLGYVSDYRDLRIGSIGSMSSQIDIENEIDELNQTGKIIANKLFEKDHRKAKSVAKYFIDIQKVIKACHKMLRRNGIALFVIGNTEYRGIKIENARHLAEALINNKFNDVKITKRNISGKHLTPYRDKNGRFSSVSTGKKVYSEEFIIIGKKL